MVHALSKFIAQLKKCVLIKILKEISIRALFIDNCLQKFLFRVRVSYLITFSLIQSFNVETCDDLNYLNENKC